MPPSQAHKAVEVLSLGANEILRRVSKKAFGGDGEVSADVHFENFGSGTEALHQLQANVKELEDLSLRLGFMIREVSYLVRKH